MSETSRSRPDDLREAISIHTRKVTDSCTDKDCIEDLRVYLCQDSQTILDGAASVRARSAELLYAYIDVEPVAFQRSHYCIDITFYYRILADTVSGMSRPNTLCGLAVFSKRAVLCGEDSNAKIFTSRTLLGGTDGLSRRGFNHPTAVVEVLDPMVLSSRVREVCDCPTGEPGISDLPGEICSYFDNELVLSGERRRLYVTLGQFSIIRLERDIQVVIPTLASAVPTKSCCDHVGYTEDPCDMFSRIAFPVHEFFPKGCQPGTDDCHVQSESSYTTTGG